MRHALLLMPLMGCIADPGEYFYGVDLTQVDLVVEHPDQGVYPDISVMNHDNNPFASTGVTEDEAWDLFAAGQLQAAWYAWATRLVVQPYGQPQFNTAAIAHELYLANGVDDEELVWVREIAIGGYTAMLEEWPDARQYAADGSYSWPLGPLAYEGILSLGGDAEGYALVETVDGELAVVPQ